MFLKSNKGKITINLKKKNSLDFHNKKKQKVVIFCFRDPIHLVSYNNNFNRLWLIMKTLLKTNNK